MTILERHRGSEAITDRSGKALKSYGSGVAFITAKGFLYAAEAGMQHIWNSASSDDVVVELRKNRGAIIASAINLSLSAELAIKCLLSAYGLDVPSDHDLHRLYRRLPKDVKDHVSKIYEKNHGSYNTVIHIGPNNDKNRSSNRKVITGSLERAVKRSRKTFNKFRIVYELGSKPTSYDIGFHFTELRFIVEALLMPCSQIYRESKIYVKKDSGVDYRKIDSIAGSSNYSTPVKLAVETALQLSGPGRYFLEKKSGDLGKPTNEDVLRLPAIVVGSALATEMCLKSVCLVLNIPYGDKSHRLLDIYLSLPSKVQKEIKLKYEKNMANGGGRSFAFTWTDKKFDNQKTHSAIHSSNHNTDIENILKRTSSSYVEWRYCYEKNSDSDQRDLEIPLGAILHLVDASIAIAVNVINNPAEYV